MTALLYVIPFAVVALLLWEIVGLIAADTMTGGVRSHPPANTRTQLAARPFTARTEHLVARTGCLLRRREPLLSAWPTPALTAGPPAIGQTIPAEFLPVRRSRELSTA